LPPRVVTVAMRVDDQDGLVRQLPGRRPDVSDAESGVDEDGPFRALDEEAVNVAGLTDQPGARFYLLGREPGVRRMLITA